jgi:hypothetical protein
LPQIYWLHCRVSPARGSRPRIRSPDPDELMLMVAFLALVVMLAALAAVPDWRMILR